jgi:hypothetical protein
LFTTAVALVVFTSRLIGGGVDPIRLGGVK